jgi:hypothetical protein
MSLATFFVIRAIVALLFGIPLALAPAALVSTYGLTTDAVGVLMARQVGATLIGIGVLCLASRRTTELKSLQGITLGLFIGDSAGFITSLVGQLSPGASPLHWVNVLIWLLLALGFAYLRFVKLRKETDL